MGNNVLIFALTRDGNVLKAAREAATAGHMIAAALGSELVALAIGHAAAADLASLGAHGVKRVLHADSPALQTYSAQGYAQAVANAATAVDAGYVIIPASATGRDFAPRTAIRLAAGIVPDITALNTDGGHVTFTRPVYAGKAFVTVSAVLPVVITNRIKVFTPVELPAAVPAAVAAFDPAVDVSSINTKLVEAVGAKGGRADLTEADAIVSGGRGVGGPEHFNILEALADTLGATVGASRAVVDAGWRPHSDQVGQTGKVVNPSLYIAAGISGAIQHMAGMATSKVIVAINKDPEAPIFKVANYGIVGDLFDVVPALTAEIKKVKG